VRRFPPGKYLCRQARVAAGSRGQAGQLSPSTVKQEEGANRTTAIFREILIRFPVRTIGPTVSSTSPRNPSAALRNAGLVHGEPHLWPPTDTPAHQRKRRSGETDQTGCGRRLGAAPYPVFVHFKVPHYVPSRWTRFDSRGPCSPRRSATTWLIGLHLLNEESRRLSRSLAEAGAGRSPGRGLHWATPGWRRPQLRAVGRWSGHPPWPDGTDGPMSGERLLQVSRALGSR